MNKIDDDPFFRCAKNATAYVDCAADSTWRIKESVCKAVTDDTATGIIRSLDSCFSAYVNYMGVVESVCLVVCDTYTVDDPYHVSVRCDTMEDGLLAAWYAYATRESEKKVNAS